MGLLGDLLGAAAGVAFNGINNIISETNLDDASYVGLLFDHTNIAFHITEIRNEAIAGTLVRIGKMMGVDVTTKTLGKTWNYQAGEDEEGEESWDTFVLKSAQYDVKFGLYGMAQCAIAISEYNCGNRAKLIKEIVEQNGFNNVRFYFKEIPFHDDYWMKIALEELSGNISKGVHKKKSPTVSIEEGNATIGSILLKKLDEICKRKLDSIFNPDTLSLTKEDDEHHFVFSDGNVSIDIVYEEYDKPSIVSRIFLEYKKGQKSLLFSYFNYITNATLNLTSGDTYFYVTLDSNDDETVFNLDDVFNLLKTQNVEVPEDFSSTLSQFIETLASLSEYLAEKLLREKLKSIMTEDSLPQEVMNALEILELTEDNCSITEIKKAYRNLVKEFHPDKMQGLTGKMKALAESKMSELNDAYNFLLEYFEID